MKQKILDILDPYLVFLATKATCKNPCVPLMQFALLGNKLYFCTAKEIYKYLKSIFCSLLLRGNEYKIIRFSDRNGIIRG